MHPDHVQVSKAVGMHWPWRVLVPQHLVDLGLSVDLNGRRFEVPSDYTHWSSWTSAFAFANSVSDAARERLHP